MFIPNYIKEKYEFIDINPLGAGGFGAVFLIRDKRVFNEGVLKIISKQNTNKKYFDKEKNFLLKVKGPNIVKLIDYYEDDKSDYYYFVFEKMEGDLQQLLDTKYKNGMPLEMIKKIFSQLNSALQLMKNFEISHRDLKPANILYSYIDSNKNDFIIKLADFGLARSFGIPIKTLTHEILTLWYRAPEILLGQKEYSTPVDIWSIGLIFYEMAHKRPLFSGDCEIDQIFRIFQMFGTPNENTWPGVTKLPEFKFTFPRFKGKGLNSYNKNIDPIGLDLLSKMIQIDPCKRISAKQALQHPYFNDLRKMFG